MARTAPDRTIGWMQTSPPPACDREPSPHAARAGTRAAPAGRPRSRGRARRHRPGCGRIGCDMPPLADARTAAAAGAGWSVLGEYRVSPRPTSLANRSREPIVAAHPFNPSRLAVVYAAGPGEHSHPVIRISHDGGRTWRTAAGHPRGGGSHPMVAWGPGPRRGHGAPLLRRDGRRPRRTTTSSSATATTRAGPGTWASSPTTRAAGRSAWGTWPSTPTRPAPTTARSTSRTTGPRTRRGATASTWSRRATTATRSPTPRSRSSPPPAGYGDAWRIGYKLATAPDGSAYVAGYQLDMKTWRQSSPVRQGRLLEHRADRLRGRPPALRPQGAPADPRAQRAGDEAAGDRLEPRLDARPEGRQRGPGGAPVGDRPRRGSRWAHLLRGRG